MVPLKKKTRKRVTKQLRKLVKKHGEDVITGMVATAASSVAPKAADDRPKLSKKHKTATATTDSDTVTQPKKQQREKRSKSTTSHATTA